MNVDVVAAAIVRDGRVLVAHRSGEPRGWEFPGGKVEAGETREQALARECREELGVDVSVGPQLGTTGSLSAGRILSLTVFACALERGEPRAGDDHDELRWPAPDELAGLTWLPLDAGLVAAVRDRVNGCRGN